MQLHSYHTSNSMNRESVTLHVHACTCTWLAYYTCICILSGFVSIPIIKKLKLLSTTFYNYCHDCATSYMYVIYTTCTTGSTNEIEWCTDNFQHVRFQVQIQGHIPETDHKIWDGKHHWNCWPWMWSPQILVLPTGFTLSKSDTLFYMRNGVCRIFKPQKWQSPMFPLHH
jgi:hypothetical protein